MPMEENQWVIRCCVELLCCVERRLADEVSSLAGFGTLRSLLAALAHCVAEVCVGIFIS